MSIFWAGLATAGFDLSFSGRLVRADASPFAGPVDLELRFFTAVSGGSPVDKASFQNVPLMEGMFHVVLSDDIVDFDGIFSHDTIWVEVFDVTHGKVYPRQKYQAVPYALRVPIDEATLQFDGNGKLHVDPSALDLSGAPQSSLVLTDEGSGSEVSLKADGAGGSVNLTFPTTGEAPNRVLKTDGNGNLMWAPDISTGGVNPGDVTTLEIADDTITNGDISTSAAIDQSKISGLSTSLAGKADASHLHGAADITQDATHRFITDTELTNWNQAHGWGDHAAAGYLTSIPWDAPGAIGTTTPAVGTFTALSVSSGLQLLDDDTHSLTLEVPANLMADFSLQFPGDDGNNGQVLGTDGSGTLYWTNAGSGDPNAQAICATGEYLDGDGNCVNSGEIVTAGGGIKSGDGDSVTTGMVVDGTLTNVDISTSAAIDQSKISGLSTSLAGKADASHLHGAADITQDATHRFITDTERTNWNQAHGWGNHAAAGYLAGPGTNGTNGQILATNGTGTLYWTNAPPGDPNAKAVCATGRYLDGDGNCVTAGGIVTAGGGVQAADVVAVAGDTMTGALDLTGGSGSVFASAPLEVRHGGKPRISFHIPGVVASQLGMASNGMIRTYDNPGTGYEQFGASNLYLDYQSAFISNKLVTGYVQATGAGVRFPDGQLQNRAANFTRQNCSFTAFTDVGNDDVGPLRICPVGKYAAGLQCADASAPANPTGEDACRLQCCLP